jgi:PAS domain S-box-containing protein
MNYRRNQECEMKKKNDAKTSLNVLSLEDSPQDFEIIRELLIDAGYDLKMDRVENEQDYVLSLRSQKYDIVLCDFKLPGYDAFMALRRSIEICPDIPFICVSGSIGEETAIELIKQGAVDYVLKDKLGRLSSSVKRALDEVREKKARKQAEVALQVSQAKYQAIFESTGTATLVVTEDTTITMANQECFSLTGYFPGELVGQKWTKYVAAESLQEMFKYHNLRRENPSLAPKKYEVKLINKRGETRDAILDVGIVSESGLSIVSILDITERKRAEEALQISEKRYRTFINSTPDMVFLKDGKFQHILANKILCNFYGKTEEEIRGKTDFALMPKQNAAACRKTDEKVLATNSLTVNEEIAGDQYYETIKFPVEIGEGLLGVGGYIRNVTERKHAEEALKESELKFRAIFDNASDGMFLVDLETQKFFMCNASCAKMLGVSQEEFTVLCIADIHPEEDLPFIYEQVGKFSKGLTGTRNDLRFKRKDGSIFTADLSPALLKIAERRYLLIIFKDITERKRAEEAIRESEKRLGDIMFSMADWVWEVDENGVYTYSSQHAFDILGRTNEDIIGKTPFDFMPPDEAKRVAPIFSEIVANKKPIKDLENWNIGKDGKKICLFTNGVPILDEDGNLKGYRGVDKDITERKQAEEALLIKDAAIESSVSAIGLTDLQGKLIYVNNAYVKMWGYDDAKELLGKDIYEFADSKETVDEAMMLLQSGKGYIKENVVRKKDETLFYVQMSANVVKSHDGKPICMMASFIDITERVRAEKAMYESESKFRLLYQSMNEGVAIHEFIYDDKGKATDYRIIDVNSAFEKHTGIAVEKAIGSLASELYGVDPPPYIEQYRQVMETGQSQHFESFLPELDRYFDISVFTPKSGWFATVFMDITERKRQEQLIQKSEKRFRELFNDAPVGYHELDAQGRIIRVNRTELEMIGYTEEDMIGQFVWKFIENEEESRQRVLSKLSGTLQPGKASERGYRKKDRTIFSVLTEDRILRDSDGCIIGIRTTVQDISELKQAEKALKESEERYRTLVEVSPDAIYTISEDGTITALNPAFETITGWSRAEWIGKSYAGMVHPEDLQSNIERFQKVLHGETQQAYEVRMCSKSGTYLIGEFVSAPHIRDGKVVGMHGIARDITKRKEMEAKVRESEAYYRTLVNTSPDAIFIADPDGRTTFVSQKTYEIFRIPPKQQIAGMSILNWVAPEEHDNVMKRFRDILSGHSKAEIKAYKLLKDDRTPFWGEIASSPLMDAHGKFVGLLVICRDITDRKQAEKALLKSEQEYRTLINSMNEGILQVGTDDEILFVNNRLCEMSGYTREELIGKIGNEVLMEKEGRKLIKEKNILRQKGTADVYEIQVKKKSGDHIWVQISGTPIVNERNEVTGSLGVFTDITEKKLAEKALHYSEERYRLIADNVGDVIWKLDVATQRFSYMSPSVERLDGFNAEEILALPLEQVLTLKSYESMVENFTKRIMAFESGDESVRIQTNELEQLHKNGSIIPTEVVTTLIAGNDQKVYEIVGVTRNISERKHAETNLKKLSQAVEQSPVLIVITDTAGNIEYVNPEFSKITGYTFEEILGQNTRILKSGEKPAEAYKELWDAITSGKKWHGEFRNKKKNGNLYWQDSSISPITNEEGKIINYLMVAEDITERKLLQSQFLQSQRMESIGTLAGGIAHDLNNILSPIMMSIQILRNRYPDEYANRMLDTLEISTRRGADIVKQVLAFGRGVESSRILLQPKHIINEIVKIMKDTFPKNINLIVNIPKDLWIINADMTQMHQVLLNLCVNARDAMPDGGKLSIVAENAVVDESYARMKLDVKVGNYVVTAISDTGTGIPRKIIDKIFEPFFTTKEIGKGTGLGLSTVLAIVKSHEGFINVYSEMGKGTSFKVYIPAQTSRHIIKDEGKKILDIPVGDGELILVIDDEKSICEITRETLETYGYKVLTANDGAEAVSVYAENKNKIAVVITDMAMPVMDGSNTIRVMQRMNPSVSIIATSGIATNKDTALNAGRGVRAFIEKPYTAEKLLKILHDVITGS